MERLWAPWRMMYIRGLDKSDGCFLCAAGRDSARDEENFVVWRGQEAFCIMNRFPYNNGHLLVAPYCHEATLSALTCQTRAALIEGLTAMQKLLERVLTPDGFNVGINLGRVAGAGVADHLHLHIVPRWDGDTNFMPVISDTKVVPQALSDLYAKLKAAAEE
jgi:ATP adenylyltransferase